MKKLTRLLILTFLSASALLYSQTFNVNKDHLPLISLDGLWRFHTGDNPAWANPAFDDSQWSLLRSDQNWTSQGYPGYSGVAWYRFEVAIPANIEEPAILFPEIDDCYQVFADGKLIGTFGKMPPDATNYGGGGYYKVYPLPTTSTGNHAQRKMRIALRVWLDPAQVIYGSGPDAGGGLVGDKSQLLHHRNVEMNSSQWANASLYTVALLQTLAGLGALILFLLRRKETEYFWFSIMMLFTSCDQWLTFSYTSVAWNNNFLNYTGVLNIIAGLAAIAFYQRLLQPGHTSWMKVAIVFTILGGVNPALSELYPKSISIGIALLVNSLCELPPLIWILGALFIGVRRRSIDARLLAIPVLLQSSVQTFGSLATVTDFFGLQHRFRYAWLIVARSPFRIELHQVTDVLFLLGVFGILVLRFTRTRSEQERYATEVEGARSVQQFLIPETPPTIPGLIIHSEYLPAREVGGDFFQIIPFASEDPSEDGVLIVVGDVGGKGLEAGMLATLLVGAIRTAFTFTRDPAVILATLNNRLHGKGNATCLALSIATNGESTLVNAGHLPPYLNGDELPIEGALPLGTIPNLDFPVFHFNLALGDTLTLISDGVVEAQRPGGELFGFERVATQLSSGTSAYSMAKAAQAFGQEDDITVLTLQRIDVLEVARGSSSGTSQS